MKIVIVVPCYNEEAVLPSTLNALTLRVADLCRQGAVSEGGILCVDDGSSDATWKIIEQFAAQSNCVWGLKLAHNVGHQNALWAGMEQAVERLQADALITSQRNRPYDTGSSRRCRSGVWCAQ